MGNIYLTDSTDLHYKHLFQNWTSKELRTFLKRHDVENTCLERVCYTDTIIECLKQSEWDKIVNDTPSSLGIFQ